MRGGWASRRALAFLGLAIAIVVAWLVVRRERQNPHATSAAFTRGSRFLDWLAGTDITLDRLGLRPGLRVLEIGPGGGRLLVPATRRVRPGGEAVGLDIQPAAVASLRERAANEGLTNLMATTGDATQEHLPAQSFDVVVLATTLGEITDRAAALQQAYRVLKPGGTLSITEMLPDPHYLRERAVRALAEEAGFRPLATFGTPLRYTATFVRP